MNNRNKVIAVISAVLAIILVSIGLISVGWFYLTHPGDQPAATTPPPSSTAVVTPSTSVTPAHFTCTNTTSGFIPVRYTIEGSVKADEKVLSLGEEDGAIAAPPKNEPRVASWWKNGPKPGTPGKAVLSIHTYRNGNALGNELFRDGKSALKPGDVIKLYGDKGQVACFKFEKAEKIRVKDYNPNSDVMIDYDGRPELVIIICWDFNSKIDEEKEDPWQSRVFFHAAAF